MPYKSHHSKELMGSLPSPRAVFGKHSGIHIPGQTRACSPLLLTHIRPPLVGDVSSSPPSTLVGFFLFGDLVWFSYSGPSCNVHLFKGSVTVLATFPGARPGSNLEQV